MCGGYEPLRSNSYSPESTTVTLSEGLFVLEPIRNTQEIIRPEPTTSEAGVLTPSTAAIGLATPPFLHAKLAVNYFNKQKNIISGSDSASERSFMPCSRHINAPVVHDADEIGILNGTIWADIVPRLMHENLAVRHANLAVYTLIISKQPELTLPEIPDLRTSHYSLALAHYGRALREMRVANSMCCGIRTAILCSMYFVVFESLNGDKQAAELHLLCGQRLLSELQQPLPYGIADSSADSFRKEIGNLLQYITIHVQINNVILERSECDAPRAKSIGQFAADKPHDTALGNGTPDGVESVDWQEYGTTRHTWGTP